MDRYCVNVGGFVRRMLFAVIAFWVVLGAFAGSAQAVSLSGWAYREIPSGECVGSACNLRGARVGNTPIGPNTSFQPGTNANSHLILFGADLQTFIEVGTFVTQQNPDPQCGGTSNDWVYYVKWRAASDSSASCNTFGSASLDGFNFKLQRCGSNSWQATINGVDRGACHNLGFDFAHEIRAGAKGDGYRNNLVTFFGWNGSSSNNIEWQVTSSGSSDPSPTWVSVANGDTTGHSSNMTIGAITGSVGQRRFQIGQVA
jgi:hypothetical protein